MVRSAAPTPTHRGTESGSAPPTPTCRGAEGVVHGRRGLLPKTSATHLTTLEGEVRRGHRRPAQRTVTVPGAKGRPQVSVPGQNSAASSRSRCRVALTARRWARARRARSTSPVARSMTPRAVVASLLSVTTLPCPAGSTARPVRTAGPASSVAVAKDRGGSSSTIRARSVRSPRRSRTRVRISEPSRGGCGLHRRSTTPRDGSASVSRRTQARKALSGGRSRSIRRMRVAMGVTRVVRYLPRPRIPVHSMFPFASTSLPASQSA